MSSKAGGKLLHGFKPTHKKMRQPIPPTKNKVLAKISRDLNKEIVKGLRT